MFSLLCRRSYALLWWAAFISGVGNYVLLAALPYFVYATSGSTLASGATFVSEMAPMLLFSSIGGIYADRWRRKRVMVGSDWFRGLVLLPLLAVHGTSTLWIVYVTAFLSATAGNFAGPFGSAAIPHVVEHGELPAANAAFSVGGYVAVLLGMPLGGFLLQRVGLAGVVTVDALTFILSGLLIAQVSVDLEDRRQGVPPATGVRRMFNEWLLGARFVLQERWLVSLFLAMMTGFLGNGIILAVLAPFARHILGGSAQVYSWMLTAEGAGGIIAGILTGWVSRRISPGPLLSWSNIAAGCVAVTIAVAATVPVTFAGIAVAGFLILFAVVSLNTLLQSEVPDRVRGRVFGTYLTVSAMASLLGSSVASLLADRIGIRLMFGLGGSLYGVGGLICLFALVPALRRARSTSETATIC